MNVTDPDQLPNPAFDPARREAILEDILAPEPATDHGRRSPWLLPAAAAAAVAVIAVGGVALVAGDDRAPQDRAAAPAATPTTPGAPAPVPFTLGRLQAADADAVLADCLVALGRPSGGYEIGYAQRIRTESGEQGVVVAHQAATGTELLCGEEERALIAGPMSKSVVQEPTPDRPITVADGGGTASAMDLKSSDITQLSTTAALRVHATVAYVDMRVGTDGAPGTWHRSTAEDGFVYAGAWIDSPVAATTELFVETRAFDTSGNAIPATASSPLGREKVELRPSP